MSYHFLQIEVQIAYWIFIAFLCFMGTITFFYLRTKRKYVRSERLRLKLEAETRDLLLEKQKNQQGADPMSRQPIADDLPKIQRKDLFSETVRKIGDRMAIDNPVDAEEREKIMLTLKESGAAHQWDEFELRFLQIHLDFNKKIHDLSPRLSSSERRLCYFLLLDMSTKEISTITGQSIRAVELARIRLRKKLGLTNLDTSLYEFLSKI